MKSFSCTAIVIVAIVSGCLSSPLNRSEVDQKILFGPVRCGGTSSLKTTKISKLANFAGSSCVYKIRPTSLAVCQLRIDFEVLSMAGTSVETDKNYHHCKDDTFTVKDFQLCGENANSHIYVPFDAQRFIDEIELNFQFATNRNGLPVPNWSMTVKQIECAEKAPFLVRLDPLQAPHGCLQYHTPATGTIETFNYNNGNGNYIAGKQYAICFKRKSTDTKLVLTVDNVFQLASIDEAEPGRNENCRSVTQTDGSPEDYIQLVNAEDPDNDRFSEFCGEITNGFEITSKSDGPFILQFNSDYVYTEDSEIGFRFKYAIS